MLSKIQKIWLWISASTFLIPEILWSPIFNLIYDFLQNSNNVKVLRPNFLTNPDNIYILLWIICLQFIGILSSTIIIAKAKISFKFKILLIFPMLILSFMTGFILYIVFSLRHGIGF